MAQDAGGLFSNLAVPLLAAAITAVVGALGASFQDWRQRRRDDVGRRHAVDAAQAYVAFLSMWFSAYQAVQPHAQIDDARRRAADSLDGEFHALQTTLSEPRPRTARPGLWARIRVAALLIPLRSWQASLVRVAFYLAIISVSGVPKEILADSTHGWGYRIGSALGFVAFAVAVIYGLWRLARFLSVRKEASRNLDVGPPDT
ncbi:hypothetical protein ACWC9T_02555 [Kitasatospora sp. NPDC001159]